MRGTGANYFGLLMISFFLSFGAGAEDRKVQGTRVGNGGAGWLCRDRDTLAPRWLKLVDLFEARAEYGLTIADGEETDEWKILEAKLQLVRRHIPELGRMLTMDGENLKEALRILPHDAALELIADGEIRIRPAPSTCPNGYLYYFQLANFTDDGRLLINGEMWESGIFIPREKGALLVHEVVYKALRDQYGDRSSSRARAIVGLLFSDLPVAEIRSRVEAIIASAR